MMLFIALQLVISLWNWTCVFCGIVAFDSLKLVGQLLPAAAGLVSEFWPKRSGQRVAKLLAANRA